MNSSGRPTNQFRQKSRVRPTIRILLLIIALMDLAMILSVTARINAYGSAPVVVSEKLEGVEPSYGYSIDLHAGGNTYNLEKDSRFSRRSFGVVDDLKLFPLMCALQAEVGKTIHLEYVQVSGKKAIVQLSADGTEYVNKAVAVADFIGEYRTMRAIGIGFLGALALLLILVRMSMK